MFCAVTTLATCVVVTGVSDEPNHRLYEYVERRGGRRRVGVLPLRALAVPRLNILLHHHVDHHRLRRLRCTSAERRRPETTGIRRKCRHSTSGDARST